MVTLFDAGALFVTAGEGRRGEAPRILVLDADGAMVASAVDRAGSATLAARLIGFKGRTSATEWDVVDAAENRLLEVIKPVQRLRGPSPRVSLVDGTPLGSAVAERLAGTPEVALTGQAGQSLGTMVPALGEGTSHPILLYRVQDADGLGVGDVAQQTRGTWGYHVSFQSSADLGVRALVLGYTLCLVHQRITGSRI